MSGSYSVLGMTCDGCARSVANAIKTAAPTAEVKVDLDAKKVTVEGDVADAVVAQAVDDAGFEYAGPLA